MSKIVPLPKNIEVLFDRETIIIRRKWFNPVAFFFAFFTLFWNGFMIFWMTMALSKGAWQMAAFGSLHACVGLGLAYFTLSSFINKTDVSIDPRHLTVRHYPLPWFGGKKIPVHSIKQIYAREKITRNKNGASVSYPLYVITNDNKEEKLLSGLPEISQAKFVENEIEKVLGLENIEVVGEFK